MREGDVITIDGDTGTVDQGTIAADDHEGLDVDNLLTWAVEIVASASGSDPIASASERLRAAPRVTLESDARSDLTECARA